MKDHFKLLFTGKNRLITWMLLLLGLLAIGAVFIAGTSNISPMGMFTLYAGGALMIAAFFHIWKRWQYFLVLFLVFLVAVPFFILLHNVFYGLSELYPEAWFTGIFKSLEGITFVLAVIVFPPGVIVGVVGAVIAFVREKKSGEHLGD
jgi:uncharacterized membrane protein HdeD (DUF308 family)